MDRASLWIIGSMGLAWAGMALGGVEKDLPSTVDTVSSEDLDRLSVRSPVDLLKLLPAPLPLPATGMVLIDETALYPAQGAGVDPTAIEAIEVLTGPSEALYGGMAGDFSRWCSYTSGRSQPMAGVINIITRSRGPEEYLDYLDDLEEAERAGPCAGAPAGDCEELRKRAEEAEARARRLRAEAERAAQGQQYRDADAASLEGEVAADLAQASVLRRQSEEYRELAQASEAAAQKNHERAENYPEGHEYREQWEYWAEFDESEARRRHAEADRLAAEASRLQEAARGKRQQAGALGETASAAAQAASAADAAEEQARQARAAYEECLRRGATGTWVRQTAPAVPDAAAQRSALEEQWNDLETRQEAFEGIRDDLTEQLEQARAAGDEANVQRLEKLIEDLGRSQDLITEASAAVAGELNALDQATGTDTDALRAQLAAKVNQIAGPAIEERLATAESLQGAKEAVTGVTGYVSTGSYIQSDTARTTRLADRELIAAEEKIEAIDQLLADPATTEAGKVILLQMRNRLSLQQQAAADLLAANGWLTSAGYGIDVGLTLCGAKLVQLGKNLIVGAVRRGTARQVAAQTTTSAVTREGVESGTTSVTHVMQRPPIDVRTLGRPEMREAINRVRRLADEKHGGDFMKALDEVLDEIIGTDILPVASTAEVQAVRQAMEAALRTAPQAAAGGAGVRAAGPGGTTLIEGVWRGFSNSGAAPNGTTTLFGFGAPLLTFGWLQQGFDQDPLIGERGNDGSFSVWVPRSALAVGGERAVDLDDEEPPAKLVLFDGTPPSYRLDGAPRLQFGAHYYYAVPGAFDEKALDGATAEVNACRDKLLGPLVDWTEAGAAERLAARGDGAPRQTVTLGQPGSGR